MIRHEDVGMDSDAIASAVTLQAVHVGGIVGDVMKQCCAPVATGDDMKARARKVDARFTSHR